MRQTERERERERENEKRRERERERERLNTKRTKTSILAELDPGDFFNSRLRIEKKKFCASPTFFYYPKIDLILFYPLHLTI